MNGIAHLRSLGRTLAAVADGAILVDAGGHQVFVQASEKLFPQGALAPDGDVTAQPAELHWRRLDGSVIRPEETPLCRSLQGETTTDLILVLVRPDGGEAYISHCAGPVRDTEGEIIGAFSLFRDVTDHVRADRKTAEQAELLKIINERLTLFALAAKEATEREQALREDLSKINDELLDEIEERRQAEKKIEELAEQARRRALELVEFDQLKDQFISVAAHELKTPVTGIKGFSQLLLQYEQANLGPQVIRALQAIDRQSDRIGRIVNDLLDILRLQTAQIELVEEGVDLGQLVDEIVGRVALTVASHRLRIVACQPVTVQSDRGRLEQIMVNLLDNAIKYSPQGGPSLGRTDISLTVDGGEAVVAVRDYGVGIPSAKQGRIFERFYRAHTGTPYDFGGIGVGLFISKEIIVRLGGRMWFESEEGTGSTFFFGLPLA